ncbi:MAG: YvcK family protein [Bacilli bacterium]|nr:YvcK family protein [Bacilli bacterium]
MNNKKVVVLGGGTGQSTLLRGLKLFPIDITSVVSVCDDGSSTGRLRKEFNTVAVGDIRRVLVSLSETEPLIEDLMNYRFNTSSDLDGHTVGNLILTALSNIRGNISDGIESLSKVFNLKGKVLPLTEDNVVLCAKMKDGKEIIGEHNITEYHNMIDKVYYKDKSKTNPLVLKEIESADLIILSMGSLYTSLMPNLINKDMVHAIEKSKAKIMYVCNMMSQPGETDNYKASDHIKAINKYLGKRKVDIIICNDGKVSDSVIEKYKTSEQKDVIEFDKDNLKKLKLQIIHNNYVDISQGYLRHNVEKLALDIFAYLLK